MMKLTAERDGEVIVLGEEFDFESAYQFILEHDDDPEGNPFMEGYDFILDDVGIRWLFEMDSWTEIEEE